MSALKKVEIEVESDTADALADDRRRAAVGRMVDRLVRPAESDALSVLFKETADQARKVGFSDQDLDAELAAYNSERRD